MWEITLIGNTSDMVHFRFLCDTIHSSDLGAICAISSGDRLCMSIASDNDDSIDHIYHMIMGLIIKIVKVEYYDRHLDLFNNHPTFRDFAINSIALADIDEEINYAFSTADLTRTIVIRSFVYFRLQSLVKVWSKICMYLRNSFNENIESEWCMDFLKFISSSMSETDDVYTIERIDDSLKIENVLEKKVKILPMNNEVSILVHLILCAPKKVIIHGVNGINDKLSILITYIFGDKVCNIL